jgi:hypothetical protein
VCRHIIFEFSNAYFRRQCARVSLGDGGGFGGIFWTNSSPLMDRYGLQCADGGKSEPPAIFAKDAKQLRHNDHVISNNSIPMMVARLI